MTRLFKSTVEAWEEIVRTLHEMGSRVPVETVQDKIVKDNPEYESLELRGYDGKIIDISTRRELITHLNLNKNYIATEFAERISPEYLNPGEAWKERENIWKPFLEQNGKFSYTYNQRIRLSLIQVIQELKTHRYSRQGVVPIFFPDDVRSIGAVRRVPCSMFYDLMIRDECLEMYYVMRSADLMTHFAYDIILAMELQAYIADKLEVPPGTFHFFIISLHAFRKDVSWAF